MQHEAGWLLKFVSVSRLLEIIGRLWVVSTHTHSETSTATCCSWTEPLEAPDCRSLWARTLSVEAAVAATTTKTTTMTLPIISTVVETNQNFSLANHSASSGRLCLHCQNNKLAKLMRQDHERDLSCYLSMLNDSKNNQPGRRRRRCRCCSCDN